MYRLIPKRALSGLAVGLISPSMTFDKLQATFTDPDAFEKCKPKFHCRCDVEQEYSFAVLPSGVTPSAHR